MKKDDHKKVKERKTVAKTPEKKHESGDTVNKVSDPAKQELKNMDRQLNEQLGGGDTVTVEPNKF